MNAQVQSVIQNVLAVVGGFLLLKGIDAGVIGQVSGIVLGLVAVVWGVINKDVNGGAILSVIRNIVTFVGGLLVAKGTIANEDVATYAGLIIGLASSILAALHISTTTENNVKVAALNAKITALNGIKPKTK